VDIQYGFNV